MTRPGVHRVPEPPQGGFRRAREYCAPSVLQREGYVLAALEGMCPPRHPPCDCIPCQLERELRAALSTNTLAK